MISLKEKGKGVNVATSIQQVKNPSIRRKLESLSRTIDHETVVDDQTCPALVSKEPSHFLSHSYDIPIKDGVGLMDIAVFRLAKSQAKAGEALTYHFAGSIIQVKAGPDGQTYSLNCQAAR